MNPGINNKIKTLDELAVIASDLKSKGKKIVQCHGCFDVLHFGHLQHFLDAKKQGDILIITVTPDRFVQKGPGRPFFNEEMRVQMLAGLECADFVAMNQWETAVETIKLIKPDIYVKGKEVIDNARVDVVETDNGIMSNLSAEEEAIKNIGGRLYITDEITFSSSKIVNQISQFLPEDSKMYLEDIRKKVNPSEIIDLIDSLKDVKVLVIGDVIIDEYTFCSQMDKASKEPLVAYKFESNEKYAGGILAVTNHLIRLSNHVTVLSLCGEMEKNLIEKNLDEKVYKKIIYQSGFSTLVKKRYIDNYRKIKLFEVYNHDEINLEKEAENNLINLLEEEIQKHDLVIVADYGHGIMTHNIIKRLVDSKIFLAVNTQLNAGNAGYNFITRYERADFISLNDREIRLPMQEKKSDIKIPIQKLSEQKNIPRINITLGKKGSMYYENGAFYYAPTFTKDPLDTLGAGDAVLAISSLMTYKKASPYLVPFVANCVGSLAVKIMGNSKSVDPVEVKKFISYILK